MNYLDIQKVNIADLACEDRGRLVSVFEWLIKQDKKQNPDQYQKKKDD
jgi:hypothetical protein